jgi:hypothetical protein
MGGSWRALRESQRKSIPSKRILDYSHDRDPGGIILASGGRHCKSDKCAMYVRTDTFFACMTYFAWMGTCSSHRVYFSMAFLTFPVYVALLFYKHFIYTCKDMGSCEPPALFVEGINILLKNSNCFFMWILKLFKDVQTVRVFIFGESII